MEIQMSLPFDADGFLRRECPNCEREFKWHHGPTDAAPADYVYPQVHWCPLCGRSAGLDSWWTIPQLEYQQAMLQAHAAEVLADELKGSMRPSRNSFIKFDVTFDAAPEEPDPLVEPDDMVMIAPPCHPWEPVKVPEDAVAPFYCLLCGEAYAV